MLVSTASTILQKSDKQYAETKDPDREVEAGIITSYQKMPLTKGMSVYLWVIDRFLGGNEPVRALTYPVQEIVANYTTNERF